MNRAPRNLVVVAISIAIVLIGGIAVPARAQIDAWIDPGHGGKDSGAPGIDGPAAPNEKDFNLTVSLDVQSVLGSYGWLALLTRNSDIYWTKTRRTQIAAGLRPNDEGNQELGRICASVHMNSVPLDSTTFGTKVIFPAEKLFAKSRRAYATDSSFGGYVHSALLLNTPAAFLGCNHDLGLTRDVRDLTVLQKSQIPTVIVECALISNRCQFNAMRTGGTQGLVANGIATGMNNYLATLAPTRVNMASATSPAPHEPYTKTSPPIAGPRSFLSAALQEGFEGGTFPPSGWTLMSSGASQPYTWHRSTDSLYVAVGSGAALVQGVSPGAIDEWLISPTFFVSASDTSLHFRWLSNPFFASAANAHCAIRPKGSSTWTDAWTLQQEPQAVSFQYPDRVVSLTPWLSDSVQVAFRVNGTSGPDVAIDDVSTGVFPLTGPPANDLPSAAIQLPAGSFTISGSTCYANDDRNPFPADSSASSCVPDDASGGDVFYKLTAKVGDSLTVAATNNCSYHPLLYLLDSSSPSANCVAGQGDADSDEAPSFQYLFSSSGTYYLAVDAIPDECGRFELAITFRGATTGVAPGLDRVAAPLRMSASPSPSLGAVRFAIAGGRPGIGVLRLYDLTGRRVMERAIGFTGGVGNAEWDGRDPTGARVPAGIYLATCEFGSEKCSARVTVLK